MEKYGVIYRIHNKVTDNNYIGKTTRNFKERYGNLKGFIREKKSTKAIQEDYNEYGIESFEVFEEIDCTYKTSDEEYNKDLLSITEAYYIDKYNAYGIYNTRPCDYPLSISLFPDVKEGGRYIKYKFELEDYYNYLFTDKHLKHFNKLTEPKKKHRYSKYLIKKYDVENDIDDKNFIGDWHIFLEHFKGNITQIYRSSSHRWFNYEEFRKNHIELYPISKLTKCLHCGFVAMADGISTLCFHGEEYNKAKYMAEKYKLTDIYNNISIVPWIGGDFCRHLEKYNLNYIIFIDDLNLVYDSNSVKFDKFLHELFNTLNNDFKNRNEHFISDNRPKHHYINDLKRLIKIRNDKLIKELN